MGGGGVEDAVEAGLLPGAGRHVDLLFAIAFQASLPAPFGEAVEERTVATSAPDLAVGRRVLFPGQGPARKDVACDGSPAGVAAGE